MCARGSYRLALVARAACGLMRWSRVLAIRTRGGAFDGVQHAARDGCVGERGRAMCDRS